jgi:hypothetical protein
MRHGISKSWTLVFGILCPGKPSSTRRTNESYLHKWKAQKFSSYNLFMRDKPELAFCSNGGTALKSMVG